MIGKIKKTFRFVKRFTFTNGIFPFKIDCSVVKTSLTKGSYCVPTTTIQESGIFDNVEIYEIEIGRVNAMIYGRYSSNLEHFEKALNMG